MATGAYIGVNGKAARVTKMYLGVNSKARNIIKAYIGVAGKAQLWWQGFHPTLNISALPSEGRLTEGSQATAVLNRGTVFNNRAILCDQTGDTTHCYAATYDASLTKSVITRTHTSGARCYVTQCAKLPSYAILGGASKNGLGIPWFKNERKIKLNSSFTASDVEVTSGTGVGGAATQTTSYALYIGTQTHSYDSSLEDEAWEPEHKISAYNDSLTKSIVSASWLGFPYSAASFGDTAVFTQGSINNSLTVTRHAEITSPREHLLFANAGDSIVFQSHIGSSIPSKQVRYSLLTRSLTITQIYSDDNQRYMKNMAAGATPHAAVFAGGGDSSTDGNSQRRVLAFDASGTDVSNSMLLSTGRQGMQSSVLPLGAKTLFAGGAQVAAWVVNNDGNTKYRDVFAVTEQ